MGEGLTVGDRVELQGDWQVPIDGVAGRPRIIRRGATGRVLETGGLVGADPAVRLVFDDGAAQTVWVVTTALRKVEDGATGPDDVTKRLTDSMARARAELAEVMERRPHLRAEWLENHRRNTTAQRREAERQAREQRDLMEQAQAMLLRCQARYTARLLDATIWRRIENDAYDLARMKVEEG